MSVTALFYLEDSRRIHPQSVRACQPQDLKGREWRSAWEGGERERARTQERRRAHALPPPFIRFASPRACPVQIGLSQECCLFFLKSSLWSSDLPCFLATTILGFFSLFCLPNTVSFVLSCFLLLGQRSRISACLSKIRRFLPRLKSMVFFLQCSASSVLRGCCRVIPGK